jgi:hypothetical protein
VVQFPARVLAGPAEDVQAAMQRLKSKAAALGTPTVNGEECAATINLAGRVASPKDVTQVPHRRCYLNVADPTCVAR